MKLVTVLNFKGGCGKTFCAVVLAQLLMIAEKKTAVIDLDVQLNAVNYLRHVNGRNVFPGIDVIPSPGAAPDREALGAYDFVIADTPPAIIQNDVISATIERTDLFIIPVTLQRNALFGFDKTLELLPDGRPILPVCSMGPQAKTRGKRELLRLVREQLEDGDGDLLPAVFLPWYDRIDENLSARRDFFFLLREEEYTSFERLRDAVLNAVRPV